jgi:hypothetical protein
MAKREPNVGRWAKGKPKHYKRETSKERAEREFERRLYFEQAKRFAKAIVSERRNDEARDALFENKAKLAFLGQVFCSRDVPRLLRLIADFLEGKPPSVPDDDFYCRAVEAAYGEACSRMPRVRASPFSDDDLLELSGVSYTLDPNVFIVSLPSFSGYITTLPSFSEFLEVFQKQNPKLKVENRTMRRTLQRLGFETRPDRLGRPRKK